MGKPHCRVEGGSRAGCRHQWLLLQLQLLLPHNAAKKSAASGQRPAASGGGGGGGGGPTDSAPEGQGEVREQGVGYAMGRGVASLGSLLTPPAELVATTLNVYSTPGVKAAANVSTCKQGKEGGGGA